jgi:hypothetical protein
VRERLDEVFGRGLTDHVEESGWIFRR